MTSDVFVSLCVYSRGYTSRLLMCLQPCVCIAVGTHQDRDMHNRHNVLLCYTPLYAFESHGHHCTLHSKHHGDTMTHLVYAMLQC